MARDRNSGLVLHNAVTQLPDQAQGMETPSSCLPPSHFVARGHRETETQSAEIQLLATSFRLNPCSSQSSTKDNYFQRVPCVSAASEAGMEFHHSPALCAGRRRRKEKKKKKELGTQGPPGLTLILRRLRSALAQPDTENEEAEETGGGGGGTVKLKTNSLRAAPLGKLGEPEGTGAKGAPSRAPGSSGLGSLWHGAGGGLILV